MRFFVSKKRSVQSGRNDFLRKGPPYVLINIFTFEYNKLKLEYNMKITYTKKPCKVYLKTLCANVIKSHHFKGNTYLQIMSIISSDMVWKVFESLMNLAKERNRKLNFFADPILVKINCNHFNDLVIHFDKVYDIDFRGKKDLL